MKASSRCNNNSNNEVIRQIVRSHRGSRRFLPALVALGGGCGLLAGPGSAMELGDLQVHSTLGQPLRASVAFALQPHEQIHDYCIYLKPGIAANGLPSIGRAAVTVADGAILLTGQKALREPLLSLQLTVDCPYTAHLRRDYSVFIDPDLPLQQQAVAPSVARSGMHAAAPTARPERRATPARPAVRAPIPSSGSYRVQPGDSLSGIAARISGRRVGIWQAVDVIFAANPDAFIDNDKNLLRAGAVLDIPDAILAPQGTGIVQAAAATRVPVGGPAELPPLTSYDAGNNTADAATATTAATDGDAAATESGSGETESAPQEAATPQPGDVTLDADGPFAAPLAADAATAAGFAAPAEVIPQTLIEDPAAARPVPVVGRGAAATSDSWSWLIWLGGSGLALILGLLLFGRRVKERFAPSYGAAAAPARRRTDGRSIEDTDVAPTPGLPSQGTAPVPRIVTLDADLDDGSGLQYAGDVDVAQDFSFSGEFGQSLDLDLTPAAAAHGKRSTDIIPTRHRAEPSILVRETPPQHEDIGEYDLSMIVDATKQVLDDSADTTKDLRAIEVEAEDVDTVTQEYTPDKDVDYRILEQDYENELTATQALNADLARAARTLSKQFGKDEMGDTLSDTTVNQALNDGMDDATSQLPLAGDSDSGDDVTAAMPAGGNERSDDATSHLAVSSNMSLDDTANEEIALDVPAADNDPTVEAEIDSTTLDTRKMRAS